MLTRLAKYLKSHPLTANVMEEQQMPTAIRNYVDTDHAGDAITRRSTTGLATRLGRHTVKTSSNLQSTVSMSSGESEWYGMVKGAAVGLGLQSLLADWGLEMEVIVLSDSSAARGFSQRVGLGKMRHVQTRYLWLQERVKEGHIRVLAIRGKNNPADLLTKSLSGKMIEKFMKTLGFEAVVDAGGRHKEVLGRGHAPLPKS